MPKEVSSWALVCLDYECFKCKKVEERVVSNEKRDMQDCTKCGTRMRVQFPLGNQLDYETAPFKKFYDHVSPACVDYGEGWVDSRSEWRKRLKRSKEMGFSQGYKGGGVTLSKESLERAEKEVRKRYR